jgi:hypothetical protein
MPDPRIECGAALLQRTHAPVFAFELEQVVDEHAHRRFRERLRPRLAAVDARLQHCERQGRIALAPREQLAIEHAVARQCERRGFNLGKTSIEALLAARPQRDLMLAPDQLQADAIPLPFQLPVVDVAQRFRSTFQR